MSLRLASEPWQAYCRTSPNEGGVVAQCGQRALADEGVEGFAKCTLYLLLHSRGRRAQGHAVQLPITVIVNYRILQQSCDENPFLPASNH